MLKYQFPAVKGCQAGKDYYICMVPLGLMSKIFATDSSDVPLPSIAPKESSTKLVFPKSVDTSCLIEIHMFFLLWPHLWTVT